MQTRLRLLQEFGQQFRALAPAVRVTRVRTLAALSLGLLWAGRIALPAAAAAVPGRASDPSTERRFRRWLANRRVPVSALWRPLVRALLAGRAGTDVLLVLDPTPHNATATVLTLGVVVHKRVLPVAWHVLPNQEPWRRRQWAYVRRLFRVAAGWLPAGCAVTLIADSGLSSPELIALCRERGWHFVLRLSADARQGPLLRDAAGRERPLWGLVTAPGQRWFGPVAVFKGAGWLPVQLSIVWAPGYDAPWLLLSDRPAGWARAREYGRRAQAEATFQDGKGRGWDLEASKVTDRARLHRLLLALFVALWWAHALGQQVVRRGLRRRFDRADRRDLSLIRLGRRWLAELLDADRLPPLLVRRTSSAWRVACLT